MEGRFEEVITSRQRLREIIGDPAPAIVAKVVDQIDEICRHFIAASTFAVIATKAADGLIDVSPKGDPAGFVTVLDEKTLVIPDRLGNKRVDSFENLLVNPEVGTIFFIPGYSYTLRVSGHGSIVRDESLQSQLAVNGKSPELVLVVAVEEAYMHCAKSIARSKFWQPEEWPNTENVPSLAEAMVTHGKLARSTQEMQTIVDNNYDKRMY